MAARLNARAERLREAGPNHRAALAYIGLAPERLAEDMESAARRLTVAPDWRDAA